MMSVGSNCLCGRPHGDDPRPPEPDPSHSVWASLMDCPL